MTDVLAEARQMLIEHMAPTRAPRKLISALVQAPDQSQGLPRLWTEQAGTSSLQRPGRLTRYRHPVTQKKTRKLLASPLQH
jgi:hypothetical protein